MSTKPKRPNLLIFMSDQEQSDPHRPDHPCRTPHADRLAAGGIRFSQTYCPAAHCCPSRATFFTGLAPSRHGIFNNVSTNTAIHLGLNPGVTTFSEQLRDAGYDLAFTGKWHISDDENPSDRGWREIGPVTCRATHQRRRQPGVFRPNPQHAPATGISRGKGWIQREGWPDFRLYGTMEPGEVHPDRPVIDAALAELPVLAQAREEEDRPWCLFIGVFGPHDPFCLPEEYATLYDPDSITLPASFNDRMEDKPAIYRRQRKQVWDQLTEREHREAIAHYWGYCTYVDHMFGEILDALEATGQSRETLVVRTSDHGEYAGAHGLYLKGAPAFREGYQVPLILRWPEEQSHAGYTEAAFAQIADLAPTLLDAAGVTPDATLSGRSLLPFLRKEPPADWPDHVCTQFNGVESYYTQRTIRTADWACTLNGFDFDELYDLRQDPHEMRNLAADSAYDEIKRALLRKLWAYAQREKDYIFNDYATVALAPLGPHCLS